MAGDVHVRATPRDRVVVACDIGSLRSLPSAFAWARIVPGGIGQAVTSASMHELVERLTADFVARRDVALGFEAPLFLPVPADPTSIFRGRQGEGNRPYSGGAGLTVTIMGLQQAAWILRAISPALENYDVTTDWNRWGARSDRPTLLLWEAFVSGPAKSQAHVGDAITAAAAFVEHEAALEGANAVTAESPLSLVACAALWAGVGIPVAELGTPALVLKPTTPFAWAGGSG